MNDAILPPEGITGSIGPLWPLRLTAPTGSHFDIEFVLDDGSVERRHCRAMNVLQVDGIDNMTMPAAEGPTS